MSREGETTLPNGGPFVAPGANPRGNAAVGAYAAGIAARRGGLPKQDLPLNPPRPPVPILSGGPSAGDKGTGTMADFARAERAGIAAAVAPPIAFGGSSIIEEAPPPAAQAAPAPRPAPVTAASLGLAPADILPPVAQQDPLFQQGYGSQFAANQPHLAAKYGVIRGGKLIPPQQLGGGSPGKLSPKTVADLRTLQTLQEQQATASTPGLDASEEEGRRAVEEGMGGAAARVGNEFGDNNIKPPTDEERNATLKRAIEQMDAFEFNQWRQLTMRQLLHSEDQREIIEKRLKPLDLSELISKGKIQQRIPIIPGKYEITLQSFDGQVDLALKRLVMNESKSVEVGEQYLLDKYSCMTLTVGLYKINDQVYDDILDANGVFNDALFLKKFNRVMRLPTHMLASIGINQMWFEMRVRKLYSAAAVGNG